MLITTASTSTSATSFGAVTFRVRPPLAQILVPNIGAGGTPDMPVFDGLPDGLRAAVRDATLPHCARAVRDALAAGYREAEIVTFVRRLDGMAERQAAA